MFRQIASAISLDKLGISLSLLCAVHCVVTPLIMLSLPIMARYYIAHPWFHWLMALLIVPVGVWAFVSGFRHHGKTLVLILGIPGLVVIGIVPLFFHAQLSWWSEPLLMILGSSFLISAHWLNRKSCSCEMHGHRHDESIVQE
jgi:putative Mn2+ efflux pump MntP